MGKFHSFTGPTTILGREMCVEYGRKRRASPQHGDIKLLSSLP
jgi:hypothetical protein